MRQLLYVSNANRSFDQSDLDQILNAARANNGLHDVTGMLLFLDGAFMQVLEGPPEEVGTIYNKILQDDRHWGAQVLLDRDAPRSFADWTMGFERLHPRDDERAFSLDQATLTFRLPPDIALDVATLVSTFYQIHKGAVFAGL